MNRPFYTRSTALPLDFRFGDIAIVDGLQALAIARPDGLPPWYLSPRTQTGGGGTSEPFIFQQPTPSNLWIINHNLGYYPSVEVFDLGGGVITSGVELLNFSVNQIRVFANPSVGGFARCI